jgi:protein-disulfide isomerase
MANRARDNDREGLVRQRPSGSPGWLGLATLAGVAVVLFVGVENWNETRAIQKGMNDRLGQIETRISQLSTKVDAAGARTAPAQRGPDPNRVYAIKTEGAPYEGPKNAAVTIAEFSDFQ